MVTMEKNRSPYNTTLDNDLVKKLKFLSVEMNKRQNDLLEEAIQDLLKKYEKPQPKKQ
jgi:predicted transcriptional regulator